MITLRMTMARTLAVLLFGSLAITNAVYAKSPSISPTASIAQLPLSFEVNQGQVDERIQFLSRNEHAIVYFTRDEVVIDKRISSRESEQRTHEIIRFGLVDANPSPIMFGAQELPAKANYFLGSDPQGWRSDIPTYRKVNYSDVYPGVDWVLYGNKRELEFDFILAPGADPSIITLNADGARQLVLEGGDLLLMTDRDQTRLKKPVAYQDIDGTRHFVDARYVIKNRSQVGFALSSYQRDHALIIDPVLAYSTYLGGVGLDGGQGVWVDAAGNAYVVGATLSPNFPTTAGSFQTTLAPHEDVFVAKLNPTGTALIYSTYIGGAGGDQGYAIAVDSLGNAFVTGRAASGYPVTSGAFQTVFAGGDTDVMVTKLNAAGNALLYSTFIGSSGHDIAQGIQIDAAGNAYLTGNAGGPNFPTTPGAFQTSFGGVVDSFVVKLNPSGSALVYSTFLGGNREEGGHGLAIDASLNAYVSGFTASLNFPTTAGAFQTVFNGGRDAYIAKLNATGSALVYSTYLGGGGLEDAEDLALDASGNAHVAGTTNSPNLPVTGSVFQSSLAGSTDLFITKLNATGTGLLFSTYLGGSGTEGSSGFTGVSLDGTGNVYVAGRSNSANFPTTALAIQTAPNGDFDVVLSKLDSTGSTLLYSTYLGGTGFDEAHDLTVDAAGNAYMVGVTSSSNFPTANALQGSFGGSFDAFVVKLAFKPTANAGPDQSVQEGTLVTLDGSGSTGTSLTYQWTQVAGPPVTLGSSSTAHPTFTAPHVLPVGSTVTFELIVCEGSSSNCSDPDSINVHITNINQPPVADAGPDQTLQESSPVILDGTGSFDPDLESLGYHWTQILGPAVTLLGGNTAQPSFTAPSVGPAGATLVFDLTVSDPHTLNGSDSVSIHISNVNQSPSADAGPDQTVNENTVVTLNGTGSSDPDLDTLHFTWSQTVGPGVVVSGANTANPTFTAPSVGVGGVTLHFQLVVSDGQATSAADTTIVHIQDINDPPVCALAYPSVEYLWPPNHTMVPVSILGVTDPNNHTITITFPTVTQDEPVNGLGDGDVSPDAAVSGNQILLRSERTGTGNGRVYVVHFTAMNSQGASCNGTVKVGVPHSKKDQAIEGPQLHNSFGP